MRRTDILDRKEDILNWIEQHRPKAFMCRELKCKPDTLNFYLRKMGIEYAGNMGGKGIKTDRKYKTVEEYIKGSCVKSHILKLKLIRDGLKEAKCEICGLAEWSGITIPLELDHIDGNHFNNELNNIRIVCPNCHALQSTNSSKNVGSYDR